MLRLQNDNRHKIVVANLHYFNLNNFDEFVLKFG